MLTKRKCLLELILVCILYIGSINCNIISKKYRCRVDLNETFLKRNLSEGDGDPSEEEEEEEERDYTFDRENCISELNFLADEYFEDLNIYLDTENLLLEISTLGLEAQQESIINAMNKAKQYIEPILKIFNTARDPTIKKKFLKRLGINKWNEAYIKNKVAQENIGMFNNYIHYIIMSKFGDASQMGKTIASAEPIVFDSECLQPLIGIITLNPSIHYSELNENYLITVMMHEFTHLLGFHKIVLERYGLISSSTDQYGIIHHYINSENVKNYGKSYFNCDDVSTKGVEIETDENGLPGSHWSPRILLGEYMSDISYSEELSISRFTLELFKDLLYLKVKNQYTGGLMRFGKNKGCDFLYDLCIKDKHYDNEFYYPLNTNINTVFTDPSCSSGRQSKTIYQLGSFGVDIEPTDYQYFSGFSKIGGPKKTNYCPIAEYHSETLYIGHCSEKGVISNIASIIGESLSENSFCALSSLVKSENEEYANEVRAVCFKMFCSSQSLTIQFGEDFLVCPRGGGKIIGEGFSGFLLCPDYNLICTGKVKENDVYKEYINNDILKCLENEVEEKESNYDDYTISTTQDSTIYKRVDVETLKGWELTTNGICPLNCMQCKENKICIICKDDYGLLGSTHNQEIICEQNSNLEHGYYRNSHLVHYPCGEHCDQCENENICTTCYLKYKLSPDKTCIDYVENCSEYESDNQTCKNCKSGFVLIKSNDETSCRILSDLGNKYLEITEGDLSYYKKCSEIISYCDTCTSLNTCTKCLGNYGIINNDQTECKDLSFYYYDNSDSSYKLCLDQITGCEKCTKKSTSDIICNQCLEEYAMINGEISECIEKSSLGSFNGIFSDDGGINYYFCSDNEHHLVNNCQTCLNKESCESCQNGYSLINDKTICLLQKFIDDKNYYLDSSNNNYYLCSKKIKGCNKCNNAEECIECNNDYDLDENDKCIHSSMITMLRYYLDPNTGRYVSCTKIKNCEECNSESSCSKCQNGYRLNNNVCEIIDNEKNDDNNKKLKAMTTAAIILGTFASAASIFALVLLLMKIFFKKDKYISFTDGLDIHNKNNNNIENQEINQASKRSIKNTNVEINNN